MGNMVQYGLWGSCSNHCAFCLRKDKKELNKEQMIREITETRKNLDIVDWKGKFSDGVSLLGGELFHITDTDVQNNFMLLIDDIVNKALISDNSYFSCVTNGIYEPTFLYRVMDRLKESIGMKRVDIHFSYDLKYRFKNDSDRLLVLKNIQDFQKRYDHTIVVQMILTQHVIDLCKSGKWTPNYFEKEECPNSILSFLYPHPIYNGKQDRVDTLPDFNFRRSDLLWFLGWLKEHNEKCYTSFVSSTQHSGVYKYTGRFHKDLDGLAEKPMLTDGKEELLDCGHSVLYRCYSDSKNCMLCDIENLDS